MPAWRHFQIFFDIVVFLLSSVVTGSSFMSISLLILELWQFLFKRDWPEIGTLELPLSEFLPNILRLEWVWDTRFGTNTSNEMLLNAAKFQGYSFSVFELLKEKLPTFPWLRLQLRRILHFRKLFCFYEQNFWNTLVKELFFFSLSYSWLHLRQNNIFSLHNDFNLQTYRIKV